MHLHIIFWSTITYMLYKEFSLSLISKAMLAAESENKYLSKKCANEECNSPSQAWRSQRKCLTGGKDQADAGKPELPQMGQKHVESEISVIHPTELKLRKLLYVLGANTGNYQSIYKDKRTIQKKKKKRIQGDFSKYSLFCSLCYILETVLYQGTKSGQTKMPCHLIPQDTLISHFLLGEDGILPFSVRSPTEIFGISFMHNIFPHST